MGGVDRRSHFLQGTMCQWLFLVVLVFSQGVLSKQVYFRESYRHDEDHVSYHRVKPVQQRPLLEIFQVAPPPLSPKEKKGATACSFTLMQHVFGNSVGDPFIGNNYRSLTYCQALINLCVAVIGMQRCST